MLPMVWLVTWFVYSHLDPELAGEPIASTHMVLSFFIFAVPATSFAALGLAIRFFIGSSPGPKRMDRSR